MGERRLKGSDKLSSTERRKVLHQLVFYLLDHKKPVLFREVEVFIDALIKWVAVLDPSLARDWTYERHTTIAMMVELQSRGFIWFERPKVEGVIGQEFDYDKAVLVLRPMGEVELRMTKSPVARVARQVPTNLLELLAIAAHDLT